MDYVNPTQKDIRDWGGQANGDWPDQDWAQTVATRENADLIFQLADEGCAQGEFFVHCLYVLVGSFAATGDSFIPRSILAVLLSRGSNSRNADVCRWSERSEAFLADPNAYDRECWVGGGWALDEEIWRADR